MPEKNNVSATSGQSADNPASESDAEQPGGKKPEKTAGKSAGKNAVPPAGANATESDGFCVYLGPTVHGVIQSGRIFHGSRVTAARRLKLPAYIAQHVSALIVNGDKLSEKRVEVKTPGSRLYNLYERLSKLI
ncbi:MAG: hypothetical protein FWE80_01565 [Oscillospiraceae bacterium]|nr:hypothetical protein [Oscillospiraceae bacterium]